MDEDDFRDLLERSALVGEVASHPGWTLLCDRARVTLFQRQQRLILGRAADFEEYKTQCAWMDGVSWLLDLPDQVAKELADELIRREEEKVLEEE